MGTKHAYTNTSTNRNRLANICMKANNNLRPIAVQVRCQYFSLNVRFLLLLRSTAISKYSWWSFLVSVLLSVLFKQKFLAVTPAVFLSPRFKYSWCSTSPEQLCFCLNIPVFQCHRGALASALWLNRNLGRNVDHRPALHPFPNMHKQVLEKYEPIIAR